MKRLLLVLAVLPVFAGVSSAKIYQASNWLTPAHILNEFPYQQFVKDVEKDSGGAVKFEVYSSGALMPAPTTMRGIADGVVQLGIVFPPYTPSELPLNNAVNDLAFAARDDMAAAFAWTELGLTNGRLREEWSKNGGIFAGGYATPFYNFMCMSEIVMPKDVVGKKVRVAGSAQTDWIRHLGGVPVSVAIAEVYSGLERGSIDCTLSDATNLDKGNKFWEVAKTVNTLPMGVVLGATYIFNKDFWRETPPEQRRILLNNVALGLARSQAAYYTGVEAALAGSRKRGLKVSDPTLEMRDALAKFQAATVEKLPDKSMAERKIKDPSDIFSHFQTLERKWEKQLAGIDRGNADALASLLRSALYDKIDAATFGID